MVFQSHNWPHWGNENIQQYMTNTAAVYKFINDQTLLYINQGYTEAEVANMIRLPEAMEKVWYTRQYYGTVSHNAKAVYAKYMGWYDANPVHLLELTPTEEAKKLVQYLGDTDRVLEMAKQDYDNGEYQWVAQITTHWCLPTRKIWPPDTCVPMPWSSWAIRQNPAPGDAPTCVPPRSCVREPTPTRPAAPLA